jgi:hypothetical protein
LGLEKPNSGLDLGETNSGSDLDSDETFQISRNVGLDIDEIVCLLDSQLCLQYTHVLFHNDFLLVQCSHLLAELSGQKMTKMTPLFDNAQLCSPVPFL